MNRYDNPIIEIKPITGRQYYKQKYYPNIPLSDTDEYVITTIGDRLDNLAYSYYRDSTLWWIISIANNNITKGLIKYLLYAYPDKVNQKGGLPTLSQERGLTSSEKYLRFKNMIINFDPELLDILTKGESQKVKESSNDFIFNFTSLTQGFIDDVFRDPEIYKMWYKWKHS